MKNTKYILLLLITFLSFSTTIFAQEPLQVATIERAPFVEYQDAELTGFSIELWQAVAEYLDVPFEFQIQESFAKMLSLVKKNKVDLALSNITINTERLEIFDFSDSYFNGGLQIMVSRKNELNTVLKSIQSSESRKIIFFAFFLLVFTAHLLWWVERKKNENITQNYYPGIFQCIWCVISFGEFGNKMPKTAITKIMFSLWLMSVGFIFTLYGAGISSDLTLNRSIISINSYQDLHGKQVGVIAGSTAESFLRKEQISYITYSNIDKLFNDIENSKLDAVIHDYPIISYHLTHDGAGKVLLAGKTFQPEQYGIALPKDSSLTDKTNEALLFLKENGTYNRLLVKWFGNL